MSEVITCYISPNLELLFPPNKRSKPYSLLNMIGGNRINDNEADGFLILVLLKSYLLAIGY